MKFTIAVLAFVIMMAAAFRNKNKNRYDWGLLNSRLQNGWTFDSLGGDQRLQTIWDFGAHNNFERLQNGWNFDDSGASEHLQEPWDFDLSNGNERLQNKWDFDQNIS